MIKKLMKSIREYKKDSLLSPAMVTLEVIMEEKIRQSSCLMFYTALLDPMDQFVDRLFFFTVVHLRR